MADRDTDELKRVLEKHSVAGYPVTVPYFGDAKIVRQEATGPVKRITEAATELGSPMVYYIVKPVTPMPFEEWAKVRGLSNTPWTLKEWEEKEERGRGKRLFIPTEIQETLEKGGKASEWDAEFVSIKDRGCLGPDETVNCYSFWSNQVEIPPSKLKKGMLVEFHGPPEFVGVGRVVGFGKDKDVVLLELFTPVSYFSATDSIANEEIRPGFYSSRTYSIGFGTRLTFEDNNIPLPPGKFLDAKEREYILDEMVDIKEIEDICKKYSPEEGHCLWQSLVFYILPVYASGRYGGKFYPLPENVIPSEYIVSYEDE